MVPQLTPSPPDLRIVWGGWGGVARRPRPSCHRGDPTTHLKKPCLDKAKNALAHKASQIRTGLAVYLKRARTRQDDELVLWQRCGTDV